MKICLCCMRTYSEEKENCPFCGYSRQQLLQEAAEFPEALAPETILSGRFILGRVLSVSDYSIIYLSWDALLRRRVAIREYFPFGLGERVPKTGTIKCFGEQEKLLFDRGANSFENEHSRLLHNQSIEGIIHVYRLIRANGTVYAVMKYVEGLTLRDILDDHGITQGPGTKKIVAGVGKVMDEFHDRGIVHYNLSPENIFIDSLGKIKIVDFAEAKLEISRLLNHSVNILDFRYAAPEIKLSDRGDRQADIYSLGAIWYRLESGKEPPHSRSMHKGQRGLIISESPHASKIEKMTLPDPNARPVRAAEWINRD